MYRQVPDLYMLHDGDDERGRTDGLQWIILCTPVSMSTSLARGEHTRSIPGTLNSSKGSTCFCPPTQICSETSGCATAANILNTAVVLCVSLTTSSPLYARSRISGMIIPGSNFAMKRRDICARPAATGSFEKTARRAGVLSILMKARRIEGVRRCVCNESNAQLQQLEGGLIDY
jgi:hypothetical protein